LNNTKLEYDKEKQMKKNLLFSIALCVGLMLPGVSFGSESTQSTYDWIKEKINSWYSYYMPQTQASSEQGINQKKALLGLAALGGLGYLQDFDI